MKESLMEIVCCPMDKHDLELDVESEDDGDVLEPVAYPGHPEEVVLSWTADDGHVVAGTNDGRVVFRSSGEWVEGGRIPAGVAALCSV